MNKGFIMENSLKSLAFQAFRPAIVLFVLLSVMTGIAKLFKLFSMINPLFIFN